MNKEFSAGAVIFKRENDEVLFLLIYSRRNKIWGFPKGHREFGEGEREVVLREIREETGLGDIHFIEHFREEDIYEAISSRGSIEGQTIEKHSVYFLCETKEKKITIDNDEITDYQWLPATEAESLLFFNSLKQILKKASDFLCRAHRDS